MIESNDSGKNIQQIKVAVDCIIFGFNDNKLELLLIKKKDNPEKGKWSLIGGIVAFDEDLDEAANRILSDLSGLQDIYMEQIKTFGKVDRCYFDRIISSTYSAMILKSSYTEDQIKKYDAQWFPITEVPKLVFDHNEMVDIAIKRMRRRVRNFPIAFNLLPPKFTLPQLQVLYEGILDEKLDKRNFRRKVSQMNYLVRLEDKDMTESRRGAFLYRFDEVLFIKEQNFNL
jgi:ADP-ribose pyrophosphatase YjhB (NUDIX family)